MADEITQPPRVPLKEYLGLSQSLRLTYCHPLLFSKMLRFYAALIRPGDLCFDLGSHVGSRVRAWARLGARIVAVEPQPACVRVLRRLYGSNPHVVIDDAAVGSIAGTAGMLISQSTPRISTLSPEWIASARSSPLFRRVKYQRTVPVRVVTIDSLIDRYGRPDFCKIDVEGYEYEALKGLSSPLKAISFEYVLPATGLAIHCIRRLSQLANYEFNWSFGETMRFELDNWVDDSTMIALLSTPPPRFRAGDIYARLVS